MARRMRYSREFRERAVALVFEQVGQYGSGVGGDLLGGGEGERVQRDAAEVGASG
jgi:hypothetical protein